MNISGNEYRTLAEISLIMNSGERFTSIQSLLMRNKWIYTEGIHIENDMYRKVDFLDTSGRELKG